MEELNFETESTTNLSENKSNQTKIQVSSYVCKNQRRKLEDKLVVEHDLNSLIDIELPHKYRYYAIFDGHCNDHAAEYCKNNLHLNLFENDKFRNGEILEALKETFVKTDQEYCDQITRDGSPASGSTALVCLIEDDRIMYLAWAGDSSSVLTKNGQAIELTPPHSPELKEERDRIEKMGGQCICVNTVWRVDGLLAVSRCIGDPDYKPYIIAEPDVIKIELDGSEDFLILASDGLWESISPIEASTIVYEFLATNTSESQTDVVDEISKLLIKRSIEEGSSDNITTIVIFFKDLVKIAPPLNLIKQNGHHKTEIKKEDDLIEQNGVESNDSNNFGLNINAMPFQPNNDLFLNISMSGVKPVRLMQEKANINVTSNEDNVHDDNLCAINDENSIKNDIDEQPHSILANINDDDLERELDEERVVVKEETENNNLEELDENEEDEIVEELNKDEIVEELNKDEIVEELNKDESKQPDMIEQTVNCEYTVIPFESTASPVDLISESTTTTEELLENKHDQIEDQNLSNNDQSDVLIKINDQTLMDNNSNVESQDDTLKDDDDDLINCNKLTKENEKESIEHNVQFPHEDDEKSTEDNSFEFISSNPTDLAYQINDNTCYESLNSSKLQEFSVYENAKATFDNSVLDQNLFPLNEQKSANLQAEKPNLLDSTLIFNGTMPTLISPTNVLEEHIKEEENYKPKLNGIEKNNLDNLTDHKHIDMDLTYLTKPEENNISVDQQNLTMNETLDQNKEQDLTLNNFDKSDNNYNIPNQDSIFVHDKINDELVTEEIEESKDNFEVLEAPYSSNIENDNDLAHTSDGDLNNYESQTTELKDDLVNIEQDETKTEEFKTDFELDKIKLDEVCSEELEELKSDELKSEELKSDELKSEELKSTETKLEVNPEEPNSKETKLGQQKSDESKSEVLINEIKYEEIKSEEIRSEEAALDKTKLEETKLEETKLEEAELVETKFEELKSDEIMFEESKIKENGLTEEEIKIKENGFSEEENQIKENGFTEEQNKITENGFTEEDKPKENETEIIKSEENKIEKDDSEVNKKPEIVNETTKEQIINESSIIKGAVIGAAATTIAAKITSTNVASRKKLATTSSAPNKQLTKKPLNETKATSKPTTLTRKPLSTLTTKPANTVSSSKLITNKTTTLTKNPTTSKSSSGLTTSKPATSKVSSTIKSTVPSRPSTVSNKPTTTLTNKSSTLTSKLAPSKLATTNKPATGRPTTSKYANVTSKVSSSLAAKPTSTSTNLTNKVSSSLVTKSTTTSTNVKTTTSLNRAKVNSKPLTNELNKEPLKANALKTTKPSEVKSRLSSATLKSSSPRSTANAQNKLNNSKSSTAATNKSLTSKTEVTKKTTAVPRKPISKTQLTNNQQTKENSEINSNSIKPNSSLVNGQKSINNSLTNGDQSNDALTSSSMTTKQDKVKIPSLKAELEMAINNEIKN